MPAGKDQKWHNVLQSCGCIVDNYDSNYSHTDETSMVEIPIFLESMTITIDTIRTIKKITGAVTSPIVLPFVNKTDKLQRVQCDCLALTEKILDDMEVYGFKLIHAMLDKETESFVCAVWREK